MLRCAAIASPQRTAEPTNRGIARNGLQIESDTLLKIQFRSSLGGNSLFVQLRVSASEGCMTGLSLDSARSMISEAHRMAAGKPIAVAIVDTSGNLVAFERSDGATPINVRAAIGKAYTAAVTARETDELMERAKENPLAWQSVMTKDPGPFTLARGGVPLINNGEVIGAVGVSGRGGGDIEVICAQAARSAFAPT